MCHPFKKYDDPLYGAMMEISSATSALHMEPELIPVEELTEYDRFLSETDAWAKHSVEHLYQAQRLLSKANQEMQELKDQLFTCRMFASVVKNAGLPYNSEVNNKLLEVLGIFHAKDKEEDRRFARERMRQKKEGTYKSFKQLMMEIDEEDDELC